MDDPSALQSVLSRFSVDIGDRPPIVPFGRGHVNGTYLVKTEPPVVLQRINRAVFPRPDRVAENVARVTAYLKERRSSQKTYSTLVCSSSSAFLFR